MLTDVNPIWCAYARGSCSPAARGGIWATFAILVVLLWSAVGFAQDRTLSIDLQVDHGASPQHLCVIAPIIFEPTVSGTSAHRGPGGTREDVADLDELGVAFSSEEALSEVPQICQEAVARKVLCESVEALVLPNSEDSDRPCPNTEQSANPCRPALSLENRQGHRLICTTNTQRATKDGEQGGAPRVAVLSLDLPSVEDQPSLVSVDLHGEVAVLRFNYGAGKSIVVSSAGGHYLSDGTRVATGASIAFPLVPRCASHRVVLPPSSDPVGTVCATVQGPGKNRTERVLRLQASVADVDIPYSSGAGVRSLEVTTDSLTARYEWNGVRPPAEIQLGVVEFKASWKVDCLHPWTTCPELRLPATPASCKPARKDDMCVYDCESSTPFAFPVEAEFTTDPRAEQPFPGRSEWSESWRDTLTYAGQVRTGYVAASERHIGIDFRYWRQYGVPLEELASRNGERIDALLVRTPYGETYRLKVAEEQAWLRVPQVGCRDTLSYQLVGDLNYSESPVGVEKGVLIVSPPHQRLERLVSVGVAGGVGTQFSPGVVHKAKERAYGLLEGVVTLRAGPRWWSCCDWRPNLELRAGGLLSVQWFESLYPTADAQEGNAVADSVWYVHVPISLNVVHVQTSPFWFGLGLGMDIGFPLFEEDNRLAYGQTRPFLNGFVGWWFTRATALEFGGRFMKHQFFRYRFDYRGQPEAEPGGLEGSLVLFEGRVRFGD